MNLEEIYNKYYKEVYYVSLKYMKDEDDANDIAQDTFVKAFESIDTLKDESKVKSWLCTIASRKCLDAIKHNDKIRFDSIDESNENGETFEIADNAAPVPEDVAVDKEVSKILMEIIDELPENQKICVTLYYYEQLSIKEIAKALECPEQTVRSRLNYANKKMSQTVMQKEDEGVRLRCVAVLPFLYIVFRQDFIQTDIAVPKFSKIIKVCASELNSVSSTNAGKNIAKTVAKGTLHSKVIIATAIAGCSAVIGVIAVLIVNNINRKEPEPLQSVAVQTSAAPTKVQTPVPTQTPTITPTRVPTVVPTPTPTPEPIEYTIVNYAENEPIFAPGEEGNIGFGIFGDYFYHSKLNYCYWSRNFLYENFTWKEEILNDDGEIEPYDISNTRPDEFDNSIDGIKMLSYADAFVSYLVDEDYSDEIIKGRKFLRSSNEQKEIPNKKDNSYQRLNSYINGYVGIDEKQTKAVSVSLVRYEYDKDGNKTVKYEDTGNFNYSIVPKTNNYKVEYVVEYFTCVDYVWYVTDAVDKEMEKMANNWIEKSGKQFKKENEQWLGFLDGGSDEPEDYDMDVQFVPAE